MYSSRTEADIDIGKAYMTGVLLGALWFLWWTPGVVPADSSPGSFMISPAHIRIGTFYRGTTARAAAEVPPCEGTVMKLVGEDENVVLNRKARVGIVWLNVAKVTVKDAPRVYLLAASGDLAGICPKQERERLELDYDSLRRRVSFESDGPLMGGEFADFVALKEHSGTYDTGGRIVMQPGQEGGQRLSAELAIPSAMPPGRYMLRLYCFEAGSLAYEDSSQITIEKVGLPRLMTNLAYNHAAIYGIVAIVVAMGMGVVMGLLFNARSGGRG